MIVAKQGSLQSNPWATAQTVPTEAMAQSQKPDVTNQRGDNLGHKALVSTPLKNISQLGLLFPIYGKIKKVPNRQPGIYTYIHTKNTLGKW